MGDNYGLNDNLDYFEFAIDSLDATSSFTSFSKKTDWPSFNVAGKGPLQNVVAIKILEVQIPYSWYVFNSSNNTFPLYENNVLAGLVVIPIGNYNESTLATALGLALTTASINSIIYAVTYNSLLGKFLFYSFTNPSAPVANTTIAFKFEFGAGLDTPFPNSGNKNPRLWIGFEPGFSSTSTIQAVNANFNTNFPLTLSTMALQTPNVILVSGPSYLYVNSQKLGSDFDLYLPSGAINLNGGKSGPQIAKVPINTNAGGIVFWQDPDPEKWFSFDLLQTLNNFDLYLTLGNTTSQVPLELNGLSFSVKLGMLQRKMESHENMVPTAQNGRVSTRLGLKRNRY
jgi:hypothetical protein